MLVKGQGGLQKAYFRQTSARRGRFEIQPESSVAVLESTERVKSTLLRCLRTAVAIALEDVVLTKHLFLAQANAI